MKILVKECFFDDVAGPQPVTLSKKGTPLKVSFNWFVYILIAPLSKKTSKKKSNNFEI